MYEIEPPHALTLSPIHLLLLMVVIVPVTIAINQAMSGLSVGSWREMLRMVSRRPRAMVKVVKDRTVKVVKGRMVKAVRGQVIREVKARAKGKVKAKV